MTGPVLKLLAASILIVTAITVIAFVALNRIGAGIDSSVEHKSAKHAMATIANVTAVSNANSSESANMSQLFRVCFTIDDFDQVEADMRSGYPSAESQRLAKYGPRCKVTSKVALAKSLSKGNKLSVVYLLENNYQIDLVAVALHGEEI
ncbi:MAG: hypothetical protein WCB58_07800 [Acidobacteriaceae bacterium]